ncbi:TonB-dependent receptor [Lysobacter pythonis]|uniref:TonB-dependent receptor n=1 Tax=Solilutibacter pythonis TaxID=2483112 RepID=A0A3M2HTL2_9GAMM|nr:TonB-dependent receptor [Lysobacter pythonis]
MPLALACALALASPVLLASPVPAQAQARAHALDLPAAPLATSLNRLAAATGVSISFDPAMTHGLQGPPLRGDYTLETAMRQLLAGSGLTWRQPRPGALTLQRLPAPADTDDVMVTDVLSVEGRGTSEGTPADTFYEAPQSGAHISQQRIERFRGTQAGDVLKGIPGVLNGDNRMGGNALDVNIRGMQGVGRVPVVIDGSQQQNTVYRGYSGVAGRTYVDPDLIGGITVSKGPSGGAEGQGATGGVVSMRTLEARDIITDDKDWGLRVRLGYSDNSRSPPPAFTSGGLPNTIYLVDCSPALLQMGYAPCAKISAAPSANQPHSERLARPGFGQPTGGYGSLAFAKQWTNFELVTAYARRKSGNYFSGKNGPAIPRFMGYQKENVILDPSLPDFWMTYVKPVAQTNLNQFRGGEEILNTSTDNTSWLLKGKWNPSPDQALEIGLMNYKSEYGELMPSMVIRGEGPIQSGISTVDANTHTVRYKLDPRNPLISLKLNLWQTRVNNIMRLAYSFPAFGLFKHTTTMHFQSVRRGLNISNQSEIDTGMGMLMLDYGASLQKENLQPLPGQSTDEGDRNANAGFALFSGDRDAKRKESSAYVSAEWTPLDWLKFNGTLRHSRFSSYDRNSNCKLTKQLCEKGNYEGSASGTAPIIAVTFMPLEGMQIYLRHAEALRMPALFEVSRGGSADPNPANPVRPEHARNREIGFNLLKSDVLGEDDRLRFKLAAFRNHVKDYITYANDLKGSGLINIDYADFRGYEASLEYETPRWHAAISGNRYSKIEFCNFSFEPGAQLEPCIADRRYAAAGLGYAVNHIPPKTSGTLEAGVRLFDQRLSLGGRVTYVGQRADSLVIAPGSSSTTVVWTPYTLADLYANYRFNKRVALDFTIDNLTDRYYMDALTLGLMPSPGRTMKLGLTARF